MATMRFTVKVCDVCGKGNRDDPARRYTIGFPGDGSHQIDLCDEHASPLEVLRGVTPARRQRHPVVTPEEVEKRKAAAKKAPAKKTAKRR